MGPRKLIGPIGPSGPSGGGGGGGGSGADVTQSAGANQKEHEKESE